MNGNMFYKFRAGNVPDQVLRLGVLVRSEIINGVEIWHYSFSPELTVRFKENGKAAKLRAVLQVGDKTHMYIYTKKGGRDDIAAN